MAIGKPFPGVQSVDDLTELHIRKEERLNFVQVTVTHLPTDTVVVASEKTRAGAKQKAYKLLALVLRTGTGIGETVDGD
jgi:hypothetical protein